MALVPMLAGIEGQMAQYLGGLAQQILVAIVVMLPITCVRHRRILPALQDRAFRSGTALRMMRQNLARSSIVR
jgi:hypothetical protein